MVQGLFFAADPGAIVTYADAGSVAVLGAVILALWRRCTALEERSHTDLRASLDALNSSATALKDVAKTVERLEERIREAS